MGLADDAVPLPAGRAHRLARRGRRREHARTNKFVPKHPNPAPPPDYWNELLFPREFPLAFHELSFLLPHFLKEGRGRLDVYFTRVYNPLWTNPDGFSWMEALQDTAKIGMHVALTPTWSETAWFADYVLPMGLGTERHDTMSQETHAGQWLGFRQPVLRVAREKRGEQIGATYEANPGEVWEEDEFWIALSWKIDPDGSLGIRRYFESPYRPGEQMHDGRVLPAGCSRTRCRGCRRPPRARADAARLHAEARRLQGVDNVTHARAYSRGFEGSRPTTATSYARTAGARRRWSTARASGLQHAVTPARVLLADDEAVGLGGARDAALRPRARALARPRSRQRRVRPAAQLPAADADSHAFAGEMAVRDLAQQPAVDRHRRTRRPTASRPATWSRCARGSATSSPAPG